MIHLQKINKVKKKVNSYILPVSFVLVLFFVFKSQAKQTIDNIRDNVNSSGSTLTNLEVESIVAQLTELFNKAIIQDREKIVEILSGLSLADYYKVKQAFGQVRYSTTLNEFTFWPFGSLMN